MLDLRNAQRIAVIGGGTAGWFAALTFRRISSRNVEVLVLEDPDKGIIGVGEGAQLNLIKALNDNGIDIPSFMKHTDATYKLGISYERWRTGGNTDKYFHPFVTDASVSKEYGLSVNGIWPLLAARVAEGASLYDFLPGYRLFAENASQEEINRAVLENAAEVAPSFHFDSFKLASYLKDIAVSRGVANKHLRVDALLRDENGFTRALQTPEGEIPVDFVVDASGLRRIGIGEAYEQKWVSFADTLIADRALPFPIPHPNKNPASATRAIAMNAGWMWQIPLPERTGTGYVFSSAHISEEEAVREAEAYLGHAVEPRSLIRFDPGHYERVWCKNVLAVGLSSGFLEPLEATSISQMLVALEDVAAVFAEGSGVVGEQTIECFNRHSSESWNELRDFIRMHYDTPRADTPFWRDMAEVPVSDRYAEMRKCFAVRMPRLIDIEPYFKNGWPAFYSPQSWLVNAVPLGLVTPLAAEHDLSILPQREAAYAEAYRQHLREEKNR